jgi:hypothetical protein
MIAGDSSQVLCKLYHSLARAFVSNLGLSIIPLLLIHHHCPSCSISCMKFTPPLFGFCLSIKIGALHQPQPVFPVPFTVFSCEAHATSCINSSTLVVSAPCSSSHSSFCSSFIKTQFVGKGSKPFIVSTTSCFNLTTPSYVRCL